MARYKIKFSKGYGVKFISHLDLMRAFQRAIRRAGIPISYSKGFNPHAEFSFATPLSVGIWSTGEYMEMRLEDVVNPDEIKERLNMHLPGDISILKVNEEDEKSLSLMSVVGAAEYELTLIGVDSEIGEVDVRKFMGLPSIKVIKTGKSGESLVDIKPMIYDFTLKKTTPGAVVFKILCAAGSKSNLNPILIADALKSNIHGLENSEIRDIKKTETYITNNGKFTTP